MSAAQSVARPVLQRNTPILAGIIALGFAIRLFHLSHQSLWMDEFFTRYYADVFPQQFLWNQGLRVEPTPPLYYTLVAGWMHLFGTSEAALRSLSVLASGLTIPFVFVLGRELEGPRVGLVAALLFALSPIQINFAQEARSYALLLLPVTLALLGIARLLAVADPAESNARRGHAAGLALYGVGTVLAIWCHPTLVFFAAACGLVVAGALPGRGGPRPFRPVLLWIGTNALVLLGVLPILLAILSIAGSPAAVSWMQPLAPRDVADALSGLATGIETPMKLPGAELTLILFLLLGAVLLLRWPGRRTWLVVLAVPGVSLLLMLVASLVQPVVAPRTVLWLGVPLCVVLAYGIVRRTMLRPALLVAVVATWGVGLGYQLGLDNQKEPWRDIVHRIGPGLAAADDVVIAPYATPAAIRYYAPDVRRMEMWRGPQPPSPDNTLLPERLGARMVDRDTVARQIRAGNHVWLFARELDLPLLPALLHQVPPPRQRLVGKCGPGLCLLALSW